MLFKGTTTRPGSRIDQEVQGAGGYMNAYTSFDRTVYHINVPNTGAWTAIDILCDIMQNATSAAGRIGEGTGCHSARDGHEPGRSGAARGAALFETAFQKPVSLHRSLATRIFSTRFKPADILAYYKDRYVPNNLFFVVTGDIKRTTCRTNPKVFRENKSRRCRRWCFRPSRGKPRRAR